MFKIFTAFTTLAVVLLVGCATSGTQHIPAAQRIQSEGLVSATLVTNTSMVTYGISTFTRLVVVNTKTNKKYPLTRGEGLYPHADTVHIAGWLPAGDYELRMLSGSWAATSAHFLLGKFGLTFKVKAGEHYNLNTLIYQPVGEGQATLIQTPSNPSTPVTKNSIAGAEAHFAHRSLQDVKFNTVFPLITEKISATSEGMGVIASAVTALFATSGQPEKQLQWDKVQNQDTLISMVKNTTTALNSPIQLTNGQWLFGSQLGQLHLRSGDTGTRNWKLIDTGLNLEITALAKWHDKVILTTDDGAVFASDENLKQWNALSRLPNGQAAIAMQPLIEGHLALVSRSKNQLHVYVLNEPSLNALPESKAINLATTNIAFGVGAIPKGWVAMIGDTLWVKKSEREVAIYNPHNETWSERKLDRSFRYLAASADGNTVTLVSPGAFNSHSISVNAGDSFSKLDGPSITDGMHFSNGQHGFSMVGVSGVFSATNALGWTQDGGKSWEISEPLPVACADWYVIDNELLCVMQGGTIISTKQGEKIRIEKSIY